uniref:Transcription elongation factor 1 homolog n=2 Tax=Oryza TaxID=4527 RepID=A0A0E0QBM1_ORYRU
MGKRKSAAKPPPKKRMDKLDTVFSCPFCNHGSSVECRIDMKNLIGEASCRICQENFSTTVNDIANGLMSASVSTMSKTTTEHEQRKMPDVAVPALVLLTATFSHVCNSVMADWFVSRQFIPAPK